MPRSGRARLSGGGRGRGGGGRVVVYPQCDRVVAYLPGVRAQVRSQRDVIAARAEVRFAPHDRPGGHRLRTFDGRLDAFVTLEGPAPLSVEYGHWMWRGEHPQGPPTFVRGLHILARAADL